MKSEDLERAAETLCAMAAIPCLRGGYVPFSYAEGLTPNGWGQDDCGDLGDVYVLVPRTVSIAECRANLVAAVEGARSQLAREIAEKAAPVRSTELRLRRLESQAHRRGLLEHLELDPPDNPFSEVEVWLRADRVMADLGFGQEEREITQEQLADDRTFGELVRHLTDVELRRYVELVLDDDPPEATEVFA